MMGQPGMMGQNSIVEEANLVKYRLPTEAEWDYVASGAHGEEINNMLVSKQGFYPWTDGYGVRCKYGEWKGKLVANFCSMPGNYIGIPGETNKLCMLTPVDAYPPNCLGIYDKGGNVSEYVMDVYDFNGAQFFADYDPVIDEKNKKIINEIEAENNVSMNTKEKDEVIYRIYKGANWYEPLECCEVGFRGRIPEKEGCPYIGFSIVMEANTNVVEKQNS
jgi:formylglycine-generating enzyme required for sulfatase activity